VINSFLEWIKEVPSDPSSVPKEVSHETKESELAFIPNIPSKNPLSSVTLTSTQTAPTADGADKPDQFEEMKNRKLVNLLFFVPLPWLQLPITLCFSWASVDAETGD